MERKKERGLSLIEMLVAIPIVAILFLAMFYSVDTLTESNRFSGWKIAAAAENFKGLQAARRDLLQALPNSTGPNRYMIGPDADWISFRLVDGEEDNGRGRVVPVLSPRVYIYLEDGKLIRAVVEEAMMDGPDTVPPEAIQEVRVLATNIADVTFGDPLTHGGAFTVNLVTLAGHAENDAHVQTTNFLTITPLNRSPITEDREGTPAAPVIFVEGTRVTPGNHMTITVRNTTDEDIHVNEFQLDWSGNVGYAREVWLGGEKVWSINDDPPGVGPGELRAFTESALDGDGNPLGYLIIPAGTELEIRFQNFHKNSDGTGPPREPDPATEYTLTLGLSGTALEPIVIPGL